MAKISILFTRVIENPSGAQEVEDELNRILSGVEDEILSVQVETLQDTPERAEYKLYVTTK